MERGVFIRLRVTPDETVIAHQGYLDHVPRTGLRPPLLRSHQPPATPLAELQCDVLDEHGAIIESFGWSAQSEIFFDVIDPVSGDITGGPTVLDDWEGHFRIPFPEAARSLRFTRARVESAPGNGGPGARLRIERFGKQIIVPAPAGSMRARPRGAPKPGPLGYIKDSKTLLDHQRGEAGFDIVILGDGFAEGDLADFDRLVDVLVRGVPAGQIQDRVPALFDMVPFSEADVATLINVHVVRVVSTESGISQCPRRDVGIRATFFMTHGFWNDRPSPTYVGTPRIDRVRDAVETIIADEIANLRLMIVNCPANQGGRADPDNGMAFVTRPVDWTAASLRTFVNTTAHEMAHVIGRLCEEYNPVTRVVEGRVSPNQATQAEVAAGRVAWAHLASELERHPGTNHLRHTHVFGDKVDDKWQPDPSLGLDDKLGLFWGCQNGEPGSNVHEPWGGDYGDPRGKSFYRPMAKCRMRRIRLASFCRVCAHHIRQAILATAPLRP